MLREVVVVGVGRISCPKPKQEKNGKERRKGEIKNMQTHTEQKEDSRLLLFGHLRWCQSTLGRRITLQTNTRQWLQGKLLESKATKQNGKDDRKWRRKKDKATFVFLLVTARPKKESGFRVQRDSHNRLSFLGHVNVTKKKKEEKTQETQTTTTKGAV